MELVEHIGALGLSEKAARVYLAALELGEATIQELAKRAKVKRTTVYYLLGELEGVGALLVSRRGKKDFYIAAEPRDVLRRARDRTEDFEDALPLLEERKRSVFNRPRTYFLYGPAGFKQAWDLIFASAEDEYCTLTSGESFLEFVREKYVVEGIIQAKRKRGLSSRQLIVDSPYARKIIAKDRQESRVSKLLPSRYPLPFTEIICPGTVAFFSPRKDNLIMIIESDSFAKTRRSAFNALWDSL